MDNTIFIGTARRRYYREAHTQARLALSRVSMDRRGEQTRIAPLCVAPGLWRVDDTPDDLEAAVAEAQPKRFF